MATMPQDRSRLEQKRKSHPSSSERVARSIIEGGIGRRLTDNEWAVQRQRLIEFILTLARWDLERRQRQIGEVQSSDSP